MATKTKGPFVKVPLWWADEAAKATRTPKALVCIELLYSRVEGKEPDVFRYPMGDWQEAGVSREVKRRVLRDLEAAG